MPGGSGIELQELWHAPERAEGLRRICLDACLREPWMHVSESPKPYDSENPEVLGFLGDGLQNRLDAALRSLRC